MGVLSGYKTTTQQGGTDGGSAWAKRLRGGEYEATLVDIAPPSSRFQKDDGSPQLSTKLTWRLDLTNEADESLHVSQFVNLPDPGGKIGPRSTMFKVLTAVLGYEPGDDAEVADEDILGQRAMLFLQKKEDEYMKVLDVLPIEQTPAPAPQPPATRFNRPTTATTKPPF